MSNKDEIIVVTGATGFFASHLVNDLLSRGYSVRATVRNKNDVKKVGFLKDLEEKNKSKGGKLELFNADLMKEGSFDEAVKGATVVIHTAAVVTIVAKDPQRDIIDPAINGTKNILSAIKKSGTVKTLVMTSSVEAVIAPSKISDTYVFTEKDWNEDADAKHSPYPYAKVMSEKLAMEFCKENKVRLVVICPALVMGPIISHSPSMSHEILLPVLTGEYPFVPRISHSVIDVRDVSLVHILAFEKKEIEGRYLLGNKNMSLMDMCDCLRKVKEINDNYFIPPFILPNFMMYVACLWEKRINVRWLNEYLDKTINLSSEKLKKDFGIKEFFSAEKSVIESANSLIQGKHFTKSKNIYIFGGLIVLALLLLVFYVFF